MAIRHMAGARRRARSDDEILGADHDRRHWPCGADSPPATRIPALAGAVGCDRDTCGRDDPASDLAEASRLRAADLCRRRLWPVEPRAKRPACARLCRAQSGAAGGASGARGAGAIVPSTATFANMVARRQSGRERLACSQHLDHPDHCRDRPSARGRDLHDLHENRLGNFAVLPHAAGAGRNAPLAHSRTRTVSHHPDLARAHARDVGRCTRHRRARDGG